MGKHQSSKVKKIIHLTLGSFLLSEATVSQQEYNLLLTPCFTAYLSTAVEPSVKTEYTATLATFAVLGTVMGPSIGALASQILGQNDVMIHGLPLDANNVPAFLILVGTIFMIIQVSVDL